MFGLAKATVGTNWANYGLILRFYESLQEMKAKPGLICAILGTGMRWNRGMSTSSVSPIYFDSTYKILTRKGKMGIIRINQLSIHDQL